MSPLRVLLCTFALGAAASALGCGAEECRGGTALESTVAVQPRLVMDGLVDLAAREQGTVQITEVVFHAPEVERDDALGVEPLVGPGVGDNLVFRYAVGASDGFGNVIGAERRWQIGQNGDLAFHFAPAAQEDVKALSFSTGVDLSALEGQTAFVRGTLAVETAAVQGFACGGDLDGDPDTSPAGCAGVNEAADSDPDTSPADEADSDPDTSPADEADSDPDTSPAKDRDGDPDTSPARTDEMNGAQRRDDSVTSRPKVKVGAARTLTRVPFVLLIDDAFSLRRPMDELRVEDLSPGEVLPIDLRVDMATLFSPEQIDALMRVAQGTGVTSTVILQASATGAVRIELDAKAVKKVAQQSPGIRVVGDLR